MGALAGLAAALLVKTPVAWMVAPLGGAIAGGLTGYLMAMQRQASWEDEGRKRKRDEEDNRRWHAQQYWQAEVRRVMQQQQQQQQGQDGSSFGQQRQQQQQQRRATREHKPGEDAGGWRHLDDYGMLGLQRTPPPTAAAIASAYRREAMKWHPDHNQHLPVARLDECEERFKALNGVYGRLRRVCARA